MRLFVTVMVALLGLSGCGVAGPEHRLGSVLGQHPYLSMRHRVDPLETVFTTSSQFESFAKVVRDLVGNEELATSIEQVDASRSVLLVARFAACQNKGPYLAHEGSRATLRFDTHLDRTCVQPEETMVVFSVPREQLSDPFNFRLCPATLLWRAGTARRGLDVPCD